MKKIKICLLLFLLTITGSSLAELMDSFENNDQCSFFGPAIKSLETEKGWTGNCLRINYSINETSHWGGLNKTNNITLPENYSISFYVRGNGQTNNLELVLADKDENSYFIQWENIVLTTNWQKIICQADDIVFSGGPNPEKAISKIHKIIFFVFKDKPVSGYLNIDELSFAPLKAQKNIKYKAYKKVTHTAAEIEKKVDTLLAKMTLTEKIGQLNLPSWGNTSYSKMKELIRNGQIGGLFNCVSPNAVNKLQYIAINENRHGIPLICGRDVIHGFKTVLPIPLGQAATWNPELVEQGTKMAAAEAFVYGIKWTFSPMVDISRDPRWGRIAESLGEDPYLAGILTRAMVRGFQGKDLSDPGTIAACAKHYAGYGAAEAGRDYNTTRIPEEYLRNVYLKPFQYAVEAGTCTLMSAFNEINGVPATANELILNTILKKEWGFDGFVVSDWTSVEELIEHGYASDKKQAAEKALNAGLDMEMVSTCFADHLQELITEGKVSEEKINNAVRRILRIKYRLGLFDNPYVKYSKPDKKEQASHNKTARDLAEQSIVLLKNDNNILPLSKKIKSLAIIGMMADTQGDQMGTWAGDGDWRKTITPLTAIKNLLGKNTKIKYAKGVENTRSTNKNGFAEALKIAEESDTVLLFLGEESGLSGEAHSRAFLDFPGAQEELLDKILKTGKPIILVVMAGRPLILEGNAQKAKAILYAWHPGTMGGPAIADILFGIKSPSGKLPVTFPRAVGQIPLYYSHKKTGRPPYESMKNITTGQISKFLGFKSCYIDVSYTPLYPFGYGLSYAKFKYKNLKLSAKSIRVGQSLKISVDIKNTAKYQADEIVQLYIQDVNGSITRPVKELKGFQRIQLKAGETHKVTFTLSTDDLKFYNNKIKYAVEPGKFLVWIGWDADNGLQAEFEVTEN